MQSDTDPQKDADIPVDDSEDTSVHEETTDEAASEPSDSESTEEQDAPKGLEADVAKWKELSLRTAAEMENLRKRTAREREEAMRYANQRLLEELLPVIDNFEMGMQAASDDTKSMIYIGMDMVRKQLNEFLSAQGVEEIKADGPFDPNFHEAVAQEDCEKGEEGRILRVTRRGYLLRGRLLRPASVVVSKLPNAEESEESSKEETNS